MTHEAVKSGVDDDLPLFRLIFDDRRGKLILVKRCQDNPEPDKKHHASQNRGQQTWFGEELEVKDVDRDQGNPGKDHGKKNRRNHAIRHGLFFGEWRFESYF